MISEAFKDALRLESLIAWLRTEPENKEYEYTSTSNCLLAQYFKSKGFGAVSVGPFRVVSFSLREGQNLPAGFNDISLDTHSVEKDYTFGGALKRALALQKGTKDD